LDKESVEFDVEYLEHNHPVMSRYKFNKGDEILFFKTFNPIYSSILYKVKSSDDVFPFNNMKTSKGKNLRIRTKQITDGIVSEEKKSPYMFPILDKINQDYPTGKKYYFTEQMKESQTKKIIVSKVGHLYPLYDETNNISDNLLFMTISSRSEYESLKSIIDSRFFKNTCKLYINSGMDEWKFLLVLKAIPLTERYTEQRLYEVYNLTVDEIKYIETFSEEKVEEEKKDIEKEKKEEKPTGKKKTRKELMELLATHKKQLKADKNTHKVPAYSKMKREELQKLCEQEHIL
jgi:hypothetical protein